MEDYNLSIIDFLEKSHTLPVIDVRSPAEFEHGHMPGAFNLPLFTNEERSLVGTLYLQKGQSEAMIKGWELAGPKMKQYIEKATVLASGEETLLHCWRGGMRSNSMAWLLNTVGIKAYTLEGGYKNYRHHVRAFFSKPRNLIIIGGMTGSGKTDVLKALSTQGKQVIDLEGLARHKGSVFGGIGMPDQPTTEQFENNLFVALHHLNPEEPVFAEDESLAIGRVFIPGPFFEQMSSARFLKLVVPLDRRVQRLVETYTCGDNGSLVESVKRIERRLGLEKAAKAIDSINKNEMKTAVEIVLQYYDHVYILGMNAARRKDVAEIVLNNESPGEIAQKISDLIKSNP